MTHSEKKGDKMRKTVHDIRLEALALSPSERASLAHDLILSLDDPENLTRAGTRGGDPAAGSDGAGEKSFRPFRGIGRR